MSLVWCFLSVFINKVNAPVIEFLFSCTVELFSSHKDNVITFAPDMYCIPFGFFTVWPLLLVFPTITSSNSVNMKGTTTCPSTLSPPHYWHAVIHSLRALILLLVWNYFYNQHIVFCHAAIVMRSHNCCISFCVEWLLSVYLAIHQIHYYICTMSLATQIIQSTCTRDA